MIVGVCRFELMLAENHSLKGKRKVVKSLMQRVRSKFNVSIAELDSQDVWQRAILGFSIVGNEHAFVNSCVDKVLDHIEAMHLGELLDSEIEMIHI